MARPLRVHSPGAFYHLLSRGNERRRIFRDDADCAHFLDLLGEISERFGLEIWSYVLMRNHYHLIVRAGEKSLSRAMQWLGVSYTTWHNLRHDRSGHLFQGRFKAFAVTEEEYLSNLICYVHRNPLRARLAERLAEYPWSSYRALAHGKKPPAWLAREALLRLYGGAEAFRRAVQSYSEEDGSLWEDMRHGTFLGSVEAWDRLVSKVKPQAHREVPGSRTAAGSGDPAASMARCGAALGISQAEIAALQKPIGGEARPSRDLLMYALWKEGRHRLSDIGALFGVGYTTVVNARHRAERRLAQDPPLRRRLEQANDK